MVRLKILFPRSKKRPHRNDEDEDESSEVPIKTPNKRRRGNKEGEPSKEASGCQEVAPSKEASGCQEVTLFRSSSTNIPNLPTEIYREIFDVLLFPEPGCPRDLCTATCLALTTTKNWAIFRDRYKGIVPLNTRRPPCAFEECPNCAFEWPITLNSRASLAHFLHPILEKNYRLPSFVGLPFLSRAVYGDIGPIFDAEARRTSTGGEKTLYNYTALSNAPEHELKTRYDTYRSLRGLNGERILPNPYNKGRDWYLEAALALKSHLTRWATVLEPAYQTGTNSHWAKEPEVANVCNVFTRICGSKWDTPRGVFGMYGDSCLRDWITKQIHPDRLKEFEIRDKWEPGRVVTGLETPRACLDGLRYTLRLVEEAAKNKS